MNNQLFSEAYKKLNKEQKQAVDTIDGPVMVVAGPGTGKTQILTLRIANILLKTDTAPENILALTFTEAGATNMRKRLAQLIGNPAYRITINTFHGFCNDIIKKYPEDFPRIIGSKSITEVDQVKIVEDIIEYSEKNLELLRPFGDRFLYVRDILSAISDLKREGVLPERFQQIVAQEFIDFKNIPDLFHEKGAHKGKMKGDYQKLERKIKKNEELAWVYEQYQEKLTENKQYDFNDMIMEVLGVLQSSPSYVGGGKGEVSSNEHLLTTSHFVDGGAGLLQILQEEHQYVLVDEHQDTNNAQNKILELLMSHFAEAPNLFVVGDEKQAIFRFQGASLENFLYFKQLYPSAKLITLTNNYRSHQGILDHADMLISTGAALRAAPDKSHISPISLIELQTPESECYFIAHDIKQKIDTGTKPDEIAVLYRNNKNAFPIARALEQVGVSCGIESDQDLFSQSDVQKMLIMLRAIHNYGDDELLAQMIHLSIWDIEPLVVYKAIRKAYDMKSDAHHKLYDVITNDEVFAHVSEKLKHWVTISHEESALHVFEKVLRESGLFHKILAQTNMHERLESVSALFDLVKEMQDSKPDAKLKEFIVYLELVKKHNLFLKKKAGTSSPDKVRLMTVHKSKGLEFEHVYIIHVNNGIFGGKIERDKLPLIEGVYRLNSEKVEYLSDKEADERRLFYVALTRAKEDVTITYAKNEGSRDLLPSIFLSELKQDLIEKVDGQIWDEKLKNDAGFRFGSPSYVGGGQGEVLDNEYSLPTSTYVGGGAELQSFVRDLFDRHGMSPTALNNYLSCPWKYFYQNLVRIPAIQNKHMLYGTAVHGALEDFFKHMKNEGESKTYLLSAFENNLNKQKIDLRDRDDMYDKGVAALSGWFDEYTGTWNSPNQMEINIRGIELADGIKITGKLDRVEFIEDSLVNVIDYKTGKSKSRNELMGKTKDATGDYYRQLVFYKLLLKYYKDGTWIFQTGVIDFIEPDDRGKYHREIFEIPDEDVINLEQKIIDVSDEILHLKFWDKKCDDKDCEFCKLRDLMK